MTQPTLFGVSPANALLSPLALSRLRAHQKSFVDALASRLSLLLHLDVAIDLKSIETIHWKSWMQTWNGASSLTLFKTDPLRGVSVLRLSPQLGSAIVDRLMGGPGEVAEDVQELSEIERALLEKAVQITLNEWCQHWSKIKEIKPVLLGYETNGNFVQIAPDTTMLVISMELTMGGRTEQFGLAFPFTGVEELIRQLSRSTESIAEPESSTAAPPPVPKWKPCFDNVPLEVKAEWRISEIAVRDVAKLKVGDVLQIDARAVAQGIQVRLGDKIKFHGQPGTVENHWAIELTETIRS